MDKNKVISVVVLLLLLVAVGVLGYYCYSLNQQLNKAIEKPVEIQKNEISKNYYDMVQTNIIAKTVHHSDSEYIDENIEDSNGNIRITYPKLNIDSEDAKLINNKIITNVNNIVANLENIGKEIEVSEIDEDFACYVATLKSNNKTLMYRNFEILNYRVIESSKYISIIEIYDYNSECASSNSYIENVYTISKISGKIIEKQNIVNEEIINSLEKYAKEYIKETYEDYYDDMNSIFENIINKKEYYAYYDKNENIIVSNLGGIGVGFQDLSFMLNKETNKWQEWDLLENTK